MTAKNSLRQGILAARAVLDDVAAGIRPTTGLSWHDLDQWKKCSAEPDWDGLIRQLANDDQSGADQVGVTSGGVDCRYAARYTVSRFGVLVVVIQYASFSMSASALLTAALP